MNLGSLFFTPRAKFFGLKKRDIVFQVFSHFCYINYYFFHSMFKDVPNPQVITIKDENHHMPISFYSKLYGNVFFLGTPSYYCITCQSECFDFEEAK